MVLIRRGIARPEPLAYTLYQEIRHRRVAQVFVAVAFLAVAAWLRWLFLGMLGITRGWERMASLLSRPPIFFLGASVNRAMNAEGPRDTLPDDMSLAHLTGMAAALGVFCCLIFATGPFRTIPARLGGGTPISARLLIKGEAMAALQGALSQISAQAANSGKV